MRILFVLLAVAAIGGIPCAWDAPQTAVKDSVLTGVSLIASGAAGAR